MTQVIEVVDYGQFTVGIIALMLIALFLYYMFRDSIKYSSLENKIESVFQNAELSLLKKEMLSKGIDIDKEIARNELSERKAFRNKVYKEAVKDFMKESKTDKK